MINPDSKSIFLLKQMHTSKIFFINKNFKNSKKKIKADAVVTNQKKIPIAILTADCVPILLYDSKKKMIAAIHAGWKGSFKGIIKKVINFIDNFDTKKSSFNKDKAKDCLHAFKFNNISGLILFLSICSIN